MSMYSSGKRQYTNEHVHCTHREKSKRACTHREKANIQMSMYSSGKSQYTNEHVLIGKKANEHVLIGKSQYTNEHVLIGKKPIYK